MKAVPKYKEALTCRQSAESYPNAHVSLGSTGLPHLWLISCCSSVPFGSAGGLVEVGEGVWAMPPPSGVLRGDRQRSKSPLATGMQTKSPAGHVPVHTRGTPSRT